MDLLTFFSEMLKCLAGLAWPATVIALVYIFRQPILRFLSEHDIESLQVGPFKAEFKKQVEDLKEKVEANLPPAKAWGAEAESSAVDRLNRLANMSPRSAILEAWLLVETKLYDVAKQAGYTFASPTRVSTIIGMLSGKGFLTPPVVSILEDLARLRNIAVHNVDIDIDKKQAQDYVTLASRTADGLDSLTNTVSVSEVN